MKAMRFEKQVAVVTGAARGIGKAVAEAFHREGASVVLLDVEIAAQAVADGFGERGLFVKCDVSQAPAVEAAFAAARERFGGIDFLVNNAGFMIYHTVVTCTPEEWDHLMAVNVKGVFLCSRCAIPSMLERGRGVIINVASVQSLLSEAHVAAYTTSKSALLGLTRSIAIDFAPKVRCMAVCPGTIDTPMLQWALEQAPDSEAMLRACKDMHLAERIGTPEEVAELVLFLCSESAGFMTGQPIRIDGGLGIRIGGSKRE